MKQKKVELTESELDQLLQFASNPQPQSGFENKLLEKLNTTIEPSNIVAFPRPRKTALWMTALPLAASLLLGIWLGTNETALEYLPFSGLSAAQATNADTLYNLTEDNLS